MAAKTAINQDRKQVYETLLTRLFTLFANPSLLYPPDVASDTEASKQMWVRDQMGAFIADTQPQMMMYASAAVYSAWTSMLSVSVGERDTQKQFIKVMLAFDDLIRAIRSELGQDVDGFERGAFVAPFLRAKK